jgi:hypothetical protein
MRKITIEFEVDEELIKTPYGQQFERKVHDLLTQCAKKTHTAAFNYINTSYIRNKSLSHEEREKLSMDNIQLLCGIKIENAESSS